MRVYVLYSWRWRELNPRPKCFVYIFYILSFSIILFVSFFNRKTGKKPTIDIMSNEIMSPYSTTSPIFSTPFINPKGKIYKRCGYLLLGSHCKIIFCVYFIASCINVLHRQTARYANDKLLHPVESLTPPLKKMKCSLKNVSKRDVRTFSVF